MQKLTMARQQVLDIIAIYPGWIPRQEIVKVYGTSGADDHINYLFDVGLIESRRVKAFGVWHVEYRVKA